MSYFRGERGPMLYGYSISATLAKPFGVLGPGIMPHVKSILIKKYILGPLRILMNKSALIDLGILPQARIK